MMIVQIIGSISLVLFIISFLSAWRADYLLDYEAGRHNELLTVLFLIAAAICFSQPQTNYLYKSGCKNYIAVMMADGKTATSVCAD